MPCRLVSCHTNQKLSCDEVHVNIVWFFQENAPENISAEEKRLLDRLVTFGRRKGLHLPKDTQEVMKT